MANKHFKVGDEVYFISFCYIDLKDPSPKKCYVCKGKIEKVEDGVFRVINYMDNNSKEWLQPTYLYDNKEQADKRAYMINKEN